MVFLGHAAAVRVFEIFDAEEIEERNRIYEEMNKRTSDE